MQNETWVKNDGGRAAAGFVKERAGDCVARAVAIAAELPYKAVWDYLAEKNATQRKTKNCKKKMGRTADKGIYTRRKWFDEYMMSLGFLWKPTMLVGQGCKVHLRAEELPKGRLIVNVSRHMVAVIDGVIHDTHDCSRKGTRCVYGYYYKPDILSL